MFLCHSLLATLCVTVGAGVVFKVRLIDFMGCAVAWENSPSPALYFKCQESRNNSFNMSALVVDSERRVCGGKCTDDKQDNILLLQ